VVGTQVSGAIITCGNKTKAGATKFSRSLNSNIGIHNRPRVNGGNGSTKNIDAFQEKRSLLGKENRKALISSDDQLIRLNLGEVRIDRQI